MKVAWVNRSFLDYRVPVYAELDRLLGGNLWVLYSREYTPVRVQRKVEAALGARAVGFEREVRLLRLGHNRTDFANEYAELLHQPGLHGKLKEIQPDVVIGEGFLRWTAAAVAYRLTAGAPLVISYERTRHTERSAQWYRALYRKAVVKVTSAVCCNGRLSRDYVNFLGMPMDRIVTGAMAADSVGLASRCRALTREDVEAVRGGVGTDGIVFLYVGQLVPRKGIRQFLQAWRTFHSSKEENRRHRLLVVGEGPLRDELDALVQGPEDHGVRLLGAVDYDEIHRYYRAADVLVMPTLEDNWSLVVPEAMACGLPVMCSCYNGCYPELIREGWNGKVFDPLDPQATASCMEWFIANAGRLQEMGRNSAKLEKEFSPARAAEAYLSACDIAMRVSAGKPLPSPRERRVAVISNCPAPYRRDFFVALGSAPGWQSKVFYCGRTRPDVAWGEFKGNAYDHEVVPGFQWRRRGGLVHVNPSLQGRLKRFGPDVVVTVGVSLESLSALRYAWRNGVPLLVWWAGTHESAKSVGRFRNGYRRWFFRRASGFLCYSRLSAKYLLDMGVPREAIEVLGNNTLDAEAFKVTVDAFRKPAAVSGPLRSLIVGQLVERKGVETVLEAAALLGDTDGFSFTILGDGPELGRLREMVVRLGLANVYFAGKKSWEDVAPFYANHDVLISVAKTDRWPQVVNEAMASGLPVLISSTSGVDTDFVRNGENGIVVPPGDTLALAESLRSLAGDRARLKRMGEAAGRTARARDRRYALERFLTAIDRAAPGPAPQVEQKVQAVDR